MSNSARWLACGLLLAMGMGIAGCDSDDAAAAKSAPETSVDDSKAWQGNWRLVSATRHGHTDVMDGGWRVAGDRYEVTLGGKTSENWQFKLDPGAKRFEALATMGPNGTHQDYLTTTGNTDRVGGCCGRIKGIYQIGQDSLQVAFDPSYRDYPNSFDAGPGSNFTTFVFKRR